MNKIRKFFISTLLAGIMTPQVFALSPLSKVQLPTWPQTVSRFHELASRVQNTINKWKESKTFRKALDNAKWPSFVAAGAAIGVASALVLKKITNKKNFPRIIKPTEHSDSVSSSNSSVHGSGAEDSSDEREEFFDALPPVENKLIDFLGEQNPQERLGSVTEEELTQLLQQCPEAKNLVKQIRNLKARKAAEREDKETLLEGLAAVEAGLYKLNTAERKCGNNILGLISKLSKTGPAAERPALNPNIFKAPTKPREIYS